MIKFLLPLFIFILLSSCNNSFSTGDSISTNNSKSINFCKRSPSVRMVIQDHLESTSNYDSLSNHYSCEKITINHLKEITELDLENKIKGPLQPNDFFHLNNLKYLNLSNNNLKNLPKGIFDHLINLETLILENNQLKTIP